MLCNTILISGVAIDLSSLIVVDGKVCWDLYVDGLVVSSGGYNDTK
jgi:exosome complex component RRP42